MKKAIFILISIFICFSGSISATEFPIFIKEAGIRGGQSSIQIDSGFTLISNFGANHANSIVDSITLEKLYENNITLIFNQGIGANYETRITDGTWYDATVLLSDTLFPYSLSDFVFFGPYIQTQIGNDDYEYGYKWDATVVGNLDTDPLSSSTNVRKATVSSDTAGYIFNSFDSCSIFSNPTQMSSKDMPYYMKVMLRVNDLTGDDSLTICRLVVENYTRSNHSCLIDSTVNNF